jgi:hypothetical protein
MRIVKKEDRKKERKRIHNCWNKTFLLQYYRKANPVLMTCGKRLAFN